jgi:hypothetical protein
MSPHSLYCIVTKTVTVSSCATGKFPLAAGTGSFSAFCGQKRRFVGRFCVRVPVPHEKREEQRSKWGLVTRSLLLGRLELGCPANWMA